jgi:hypothetical protein
MKHEQDIGGDNPIKIGRYMVIEAPIYADDTDTELETNLSKGVVTWELLGVHGVVLILKTTVDAGGITVDSPEAGWIAIELFEADTEHLRKGDYDHIANFAYGGRTRGLFDGIASVE